METITMMAMAEEIRMEDHPIMTMTTTIKTTTIIDMMIEMEIRVIRLHLRIMREIDIMKMIMEEVVVVEEGVDIMMMKGDIMKIMMTEAIPLDR